MTQSTMHGASGWERLLSATQVISLRNWVVVAVLVVASVFMLLPFVWMVAVSFQPGAAAYALPPNYIPREPSLDSYREILDPDVSFLRAYLNSFIVASATTVGVVVTSSLAAFAFSRLEFRGRGVLFVLILMGLMIPPSFVLIPLFFQFAKVGLLDSPWALILPSIVSPLGIYMLRQFMLSQPKEYEESALVEGASYWLIFRKISLPQMGPAIASLAIIAFTFSWNNFLIPLTFVRSQDQMTLPLAIYDLGTQSLALNLSVMMAGVTMALLPLFIVFLIGQRFIVEGLSSTGLKG
jgi:multiple sugar transport system permease protein